MPLNASGPISLGGTTLGQSIALELNLSPTSQISLNQSDVRTLAQVPTGQIIMPTNFWGKSSFTPRLTYVTTSGAANYGATPTLSGPFVQYVATNVGVPAVTRYQIYYFDVSGNVLWSYAFPPSPPNLFPSQALVSDDGGVYVLTRDTTVPSSLVIFRFNSSGVLQWQNRYASSINNFPPTDVALVSDASNNLYITYTMDTNFSSVMKISPSGSILFNNRYSIPVASGSTSISMNPAKTKIVLSTAIFVTSPGLSYYIIVTIDLNGNLLSSFRLTSTTNNGRGHAIDNADGIYSIIRSVNNLTDRLSNVEFVKTNATGTILWRTAVNAPNAQINNYSPVVTPNGQFVYYSYGFSYVQFDGSILPTGVIVKLNASNGTIIWMRQNQGAAISYRTQEQNMIVDNSGNLKYSTFQNIFPTGGVQYGYPRVAGSAAVYSYTDSQLVNLSKTYTVNGNSMNLVANTFPSGPVGATTSAESVTVSPSTALTVTATSFALTAPAFATWATIT